MRRASVVRCGRLAAIGVLVLGSCSPSSEGEGEGAEGSVHIGMLDNFFSREITRVPAGAEIFFVNEGHSAHNAVAMSGAWSTEDAFGSEAMEPGATTSLTIDRPGAYQFFCTFHGTEEGGGMSATLVVGDAEITVADGREVQAVAEPSGRTIEVPLQQATIQAAVDAARPGDLVLVGPGIYEEEVLVDTPSITIRGTDRNEVVLEGELQRANGIQIVADGVAVENMTARNYVLNGFFWTGVKGYRGSYLTAYNNADYGLYAFDSIDGVFEHSYASGSPDSGFYIGQCDPCNAVIDDVVAENNALGYSGTNAGGNLYIVNSTWRHNLAGIVPNTLDSELLPPQRETVVAGNLVVGNDNRDAPYKALEYSAFGNGILIAGGINNTVMRNTVVDHANHGILVTPNLDENFWFASGNAIEDNLVAGSGRADIALAGPSGESNCFASNDFDTSIPAGLQAFQGCDGGVRLPLGYDVSTTMITLGYSASAPGDDSDVISRVADQPAPPDQEQMPGGAGSEVRPAVDVFVAHEPDLDSIRRPETVSAPESQEVMVAGIPLAAGPWQLYFGFYGFLLPVVLYAAWTSLAFWDITRRAGGHEPAHPIARGTATAWVAAILLIPFLGAIAYLAVGRSAIQAWMRGLIVAGGLIAYLVILAAGALIGGTA